MKDKNNAKISGGQTRSTTLYLVMTALFTALTCVATLLIQIPVGIGYINFGDAVIFVAAAVTGPIGALTAGALGSAIADLITGYAIYAPFTFVIKGLSGFLAGFMFRRLLKGKPQLLRGFVCFSLSAVTVVVGYALADTFLVLVGYMAYSGSLFTAALIAGAATMPATLVQVGVSIVISTLVSAKLPQIDLNLRTGETVVNKPEGTAGKEDGNGNNGADS